MRFDSIQGTGKDIWLTFLQCPREKCSSWPFCEAIHSVSMPHSFAVIQSHLCKSGAIDPHGLWDFTGQNSTVVFTLVL